jgi:hypothetical protein
MADHSCSRIVDTSDVRKLAVEGGNGVARYGGGGPVTTLMFAKFRMNTLEASPIRSILPQPLYLNLSQERSQVFEAVLNLLAAETAQPGLASSFMISRLTSGLCHSGVRQQHSGSASGLVVRHFR